MHRNEILNKNVYQWKRKNKIVLAIFSRSKSHGTVDGLCSAVKEYTSGIQTNYNKDIQKIQLHTHRVQMKNGKMFGTQ